MVDCFGYQLLILWLEQSSRQFSPPPTLSCETVMSHPSETVMSTPPLPCETLTTICEFLLGPTSGAIDEHLSRGDLFNCSLVSRGWRAAALPLLWETLAVYCGESEDVDIDSGSSESNDDIWPMLADSLVVECASAARDSISRVSHIRNFTLNIFYNPEDNMTHISTSTICFLKLLHPFQLRRIDLTLSTHHTNDTPPFDGVLKTIFPALSQDLEYLSIKDCGKTRWDNSFRGDEMIYSYSDFLLQNLPKSLQSLHCQRSIFASAINSEKIFALPKLRSFYVSNLYMTADPLDEGLRTWHPNFDNFHISQSPRFLQNSVVRALADFYPNLRSLKLTFLRELWDREPPCTVISDQSLCFLIDSCPHLRHLELRKVSDLSNRFLIHCAQHASNLRWLWIEQRGVQLTGEGVVDMSGWKQFLEFIDIRCGNRGGAKMDKAFVKAMGTNFKNLRFCQLGKISRGIRN
ncbi:hypothetical protein BC936DRAFT_147746 [Jimgerdemannia flammicorona]|uniref:F-box domain-containing protein n=1 Tax=Jimgerdemannia flammicorona TaxID=994334 RepID=A0A433D4J3_9FUNG|nr:hypothetical protein BC936DRAFT_147746 [Jimgerdemannia flammicorona]